MTNKEFIPNEETKDQMALIMLLFGTEEQQKEALRYCGILKPDWYGDYI